MNRTDFTRLFVSIAVTFIVVTVLVTVTWGERGRPPWASSGPVSASVVHDLTAAEAGRAFLDAYVDPDGRVVRHDQGDDTVSEGQAYAMLVAAAVRDEDTFTRVWAWTQTHLGRPDGTLSWQWKGGKVVDASSAADADLDAARALTVAGRLFDNHQLSADGATLGTAILNTETIQTSVGRILLAGNWATTEPYGYNPSYASPSAVSVLGQASTDSRWAELAVGSRAVTTQLLTQVDLPPDWAEVSGDGRINPTPGATGRGNEGVRYSYDATRMPLRFAESCDPADVALAARLLSPLARHTGSPAARDLGGAPLTADQSVVALAAQAAVFAASGQADAAAAQLVEADHLQQRSPTYYGGAWNALGRLLLSDETLGGCPPLSR